MKKLDAQKVALTFGLFLGGLHLLWSALIFLGIAQMLLDFVFWMHMIVNPYRVMAFSFGQTVILVGVTTFVGYVGGWIFAWLWNMMHK